MKLQDIYNEINSQKPAIRDGYTSGVFEGISTALEIIEKYLKAADQPDQDFTATVGVDEIQDIAVKEIARQLTAAEIESVYAYVRGNYNFSDGLSYENFRVAIEDLNFDVA